MYLMFNKEEDRLFVSEKAAGGALLLFESYDNKGKASSKPLFEVPQSDFKIRIDTNFRYMSASYLRVYIWINDLPYIDDFSVWGKSTTITVDSFVCKSFDPTPKSWSRVFNYICKVYDNRKTYLSTIEDGIVGLVDDVRILNGKDQARASYYVNKKVITSYKPLNEREYTAVYETKYSYSKAFLGYKYSELFLDYTGQQLDDFKLWKTIGALDLIDIFGVYNCECVKNFIIEICPQLFDLICKKLNNVEKEIEENKKDKIKKEKELQLILKNSNKKSEIENEISALSYCIYTDGTRKKRLESYLVTLFGALRNEASLHLLYHENRN